eukprot:Cvel_10834.t1-p1 / transcript=Cvel_10834.t1 / gene=Cvel_10834 / organism=Chromera_velia_CCMP2878 / gene_product=hypothetical protein / transcript_product=hypothetical protein / location=Cvel_scaffold663:1-5850(-) / protein_length=1099 / sequence_SO=supercontig / SO=protein_coding / is_pseudo=false
MDEPSFLQVRLSRSFAAFKEALSHVWVLVWDWKCTIAGAMTFLCVNWLLLAFFSLLLGRWLAWLFLFFLLHCVFRLLVRSLVFPGSVFFWRRSTESGFKVELSKNFSRNLKELLDFLKVCLKNGGDEQQMQAQSPFPPPSPPSPGREGEEGEGPPGGLFTIRGVLLSVHLIRSLCSNLKGQKSQGSGSLGPSQSLLLSHLEALWDAFDRLSFRPPKEMTLFRAEQVSFFDLVSAIDTAAASGYGPYRQTERHMGRVAVAAGHIEAGRAAVRALEASLETLNPPVEKDRCSLHNCVSKIQNYLQEPTVGSLNQLRAELLQRFEASQHWVETPDGARLDVVIVRGPRPIPSITAAPSQPSTAPSTGPLSTLGPTVLFCNPNAGYYETHVFGCEWLNFYLQTGAAVCLFNYRGFGRSSGSPSPQKCAIDGEAVADFLGSLGCRDLGVHGRSIGGVAACHLAAKKGGSFVQWLVADRTFGALSDAAWFMLGKWAGVALSLGASEWENVSNFVAARCYKVLTCDPRDAVIADPASLKCGVALRVLRHTLTGLEEEEEEDGDDFLSSSGGGQRERGDLELGLWGWKWASAGGGADRRETMQDGDGSELRHKGGDVTDDDMESTHASVCTSLTGAGSGGATREGLGMSASPSETEREGRGLRVRVSASRSLQPSPSGRSWLRGDGWRDSCCRRGFRKMRQQMFLSSSRGRPGAVEVSGGGPQGLGGDLWCEWRVSDEERIRLPEGLLEDLVGAWRSLSDILRTAKTGRQRRGGNGNSEAESKKGPTGVREMQVGRAGPPAASSSSSSGPSPGSTAEGPSGTARALQYRSLPSTSSNSIATAEEEGGAGGAGGLLHPGGVQAHGGGRKGSPSSAGSSPAEGLIRDAQGCEDARAYAKELGEAVSRMSGSEIASDVRGSLLESLESALATTAKGVAAAGLPLGEVLCEAEPVPHLHAWLCSLQVWGAYPIDETAARITQQSSAPSSSKASPDFCALASTPVTVKKEGPEAVAARTRRLARCQVWRAWRAVRRHRTKSRAAACQLTDRDAGDRATLLLKGGKSGGQGGQTGVSGDEEEGLRGQSASLAVSVDSSNPAVLESMRCVSVIE